MLKILWTLCGLWIVNLAKKFLSTEKQIKSLQQEKNSKTNKLTFAFSMDAATAMEFYRRAEYYEANTEAERHAILMQMVHEGLIKNVVASKKSTEEYIQDLKKNFNAIDMRKINNED